MPMVNAALLRSYKPEASWLEPVNSLPAMPHCVDSWPPAACTMSMPSPVDSTLPSGFTNVPNFSFIISTLPKKPPVATMVCFALTSMTASPSHCTPTHAPSSMMRRLPAVLNKNSPPSASTNSCSGFMRSSPFT